MKYLKKFLFYLISITLIYGLFFAIKGKLIAGLDPVSQYIPFSRNLYSVLVGDNSLLYNFNILIGDSYLPHIAYYLVSPILWLFVIISKGDIISIYNIMIIVKISLIAFTTDLFLEYVFKNKYTKIFSLMFALNGFIVVHADFNNWLDLIAILPLLAFAVEYWLKNKSKGYYISILSSILFLLNYVFAIYIIMFMSIYTLYRYLYINENVSVKQLVIDAIKYLLYILLGLMISGILVFPVIYHMLNNSVKSTGLSLGNVFSLNKNILLAPFTLLNGTSSISYNMTRNVQPLLYCGILTSILFISGIYNSNRRKFLINLIFFLFIMSPFVFDVMNTVFNFFYVPISYPYRYSFSTTFAFIFFANLGIENKNDNIVKISTLLFMILLLLIGVLVKMEIPSLFANLEHRYISMKILFLVNITLLVSIYFLYTKNKLKYLYILVAMDLGLNSIFMYQSFHSEDKQFSYYNSVLENYHYTKIDAFDTKGMAYSEGWQANTALYHNLRSSNVFSSAISKNHFEIGKLLRINNAGQDLMSYTGRDSIHILFNTKYLAYRHQGFVPYYQFNYEKTLKYDDIYIKSSDGYNDGFTTNKIISESEFKELPLYIKDLVMIDYAIIKDNSIESNFSIDKYKEFYETEIINLKDYEYDSNYIYYLKLNDINDKLKINCQGKEFNYKHVYLTNWHKYHSFYEDDIYYLGNLQGTCNIIDNSEPLSVEVELIKIPTTIYDNITNSHRNDIQSSDKHSNKYNLVVNSEEKNFIILTIPYDEGWKVKINGEFTKVSKTHGGLTMIELNRGENLIEMKYIPKLLYTGLFSTILGLMILLFLKIRTSR